MPNSFTASFASAAAGAPSDSMSRRDGNGADWSRSRTNGTQTFRRPSTQSRDNLQQSAAPTSTAGPYVPPHLNQQASTFRNGVSADMRYSRDDLLNVYRQQQEDGMVDARLDTVFVGPWQLGNGIRHDNEKIGAELCWEDEPVSVPFGLQEMSEDEKQLFATSVNSTLKMNNPREAGASAGGRKTSLSMVNTTGLPRPGARRRETSDSFAGPLSPAENKTFRTDPAANTPPLSITRRRTDLQEEFQEKDDTRGGAVENTSPFGTLRRTGTGGPPSASLNPPSASPWSAGPQSAFGSMAAFASMGTEASSSHDGPGQRPTFGSTRSTSRFKDIMGKVNEDASPSVKEKPSFSDRLAKLPEEDDGFQARIQEHIRNRPNRSETNPYDEDSVPGRSGSAALPMPDDPAIMQQMGFGPYTASRDLSSAQTPHHRFNVDPISPTNTNPYQSPHGGRMPEDDVLEGLPGGSQYARRDVFAGAEHRGQNSFGSLRGMTGSTSGLSSLSGWGNPGFGSGTPGRERPNVSSAFGSSLFSPMTDLQSPSAFGAGNFFGSGFGAPSRDSRLGLPFPPAMQDQMRSDSRNDAFGSRSDTFEPPRQDSAFRAAFDETRRAGEEAFAQPTANRSPTGAPGSSSGGAAEGSGSNSPSQLPTAQQRQMVMPDRMRWVYRDPHGNVQGPWSGLEMHDWFKAGFFTAELQVKKLEDADYEPLAQLVRRIGNSREPFLVPQIGVPHGAPAPGGNPWSAGTPGSTQPPFASAFPSFGTTLTADQQNALERRKQEEQFLMARQKEYLAQRQVQMNGPQSSHGQFPHNLQHHSSAHSLHSQPSFGSITSPTQFGQQPQIQAPIGQPPLPTNSFQRMTPTQSQEDLQSGFARLGLDNRGPYTGSNQHSFAAHERNRLSQEAQQAQLSHENAFLGEEGRNERLEEFNKLRQDFGEDLDEEALPAPIGSQRDSKEVAALKQPPAPIGAPPSKIERNEPLSLTQQVQRTAAAQAEEKEKSFIQPPPVSASPLPAPAAQRSRPQTVAEQLAAESRSATSTPAETPSASVAPWADKIQEVSKGPSLKETMEAEAEQAAKQEALRLAEARRIMAEQERLAAMQVVPPAPGLPANSTWASSGSPGTPTTPGGTVWGAKPTTAKVSNKTMAQLMKEEESRKKRQQAAQAQAAAAAQASAGTAPTVAVGSRYAQMASKVTSTQNGSTPPQQAASNNIWQTVGSSGKPKTPATVVATPTVQRTVSTSTTAIARPALSASRNVSAVGGAKSQAREKLVEWTKGQLGKGLAPGTNLANLVNSLMELPLEVDILSEAVYHVNQTLDWRRFAEEYIDRRKAADRGIVAETTATKNGTASKPSNGPWTDVPKKAPAPPKEDNSFQTVVKKKGGSKK